MSSQVPYDYVRHYNSSPRVAYPAFLSLQQTVWLQTKCLMRGLFDAFRWDQVIRTATSDPEIRSNVLKSLLLNSLSLASIYTFDLLLQPLVHNHPNWWRRNVGWFYQVLWLLPVVGASFYLNVSRLLGTYPLALAVSLTWVAPTEFMVVTYTGMLNMLATSAYRAVMVLTSVIVSFALGAIPHIGPSISFAFMCWIDAYYCFEFIWIARGLSLAGRVRHLEERWPYYFAFGFPSAAICTWGSGLANAALFALLFPAYIIMAMTARPVPQDPYNPLPLADSGDSVRYPSPLIPIRLPIFAIVIWLNDLFVRILSVTGSVGQNQRHHRAPSHSSEKAEEGKGIELRGLTGSMGGRQGQYVNPRKPVERTREYRKVSSVDRRKQD
ncbi:hypothetical protein ID866_9960 [Astraeus odoratus]|nr:hypothetical protein ID866_9960 [Astraeus odoratus]